MRGDRVGRSLDIRLSPAEVCQDRRCLFRRQGRRFCPQWRILLDGDAVVQQHGSGKHPPVAAFSSMDAHGVPEDAQDMGKVVRAVVAIGCVCDQRCRERFMRGEGFGLEHCATCYEEGRFPLIEHRNGSGGLGQSLRQ
ncbi:hypothetical protein JOH51_004078 [Rhizobium leguminosarum]|nr:hypothetical protein [Rhizobium leguminosarum]